jgi:ribonuclease P protein component
MTFKRNERLKSEKIITQLFRKGNSFACYPLRLVYAEIPPFEIPDSKFQISNATEMPDSDIRHPKSEIEGPLSIWSETASRKSGKPILADSDADLSPIEFALSVPKKAFKRAVDRNILRRRIREAYRLNKIELYKFLKDNKLHGHKRFAFMVLYTAKEELPYSEIEKGIKKMIRKFKEELGVDSIKKSL